MRTLVFTRLHTHRCEGSFPVLSLMVGAVVTRLVPLDEAQANATNITGLEGLTPDQKRVIVASSMTFLVGLFQVESIWLESHDSQGLCDLQSPSSLAARHGGAAVRVHRGLPL